ncbi:hypothetical protein TSOC_000204 [Tetrabaena socialis]|uniref:Phospholipid/glycerol acyltransferase domain-containing protein n=1 Tax=Tetrabaena socialis TaxID=47790 RepID=A0A2J8AJY8_9CHLO|nr:hypothetical protein TSOC_000204 [Tetrabaena socialis]|eukprot:PNH12836.1 hypothetical protein TSOC_000204 [Tetrabaena socialis]
MRPNRLLGPARVPAARPPEPRCSRCAVLNKLRQAHASYTDSDDELVAPPPGSSSCSSRASAEGVAEGTPGPTAGSRGAGAEAGALAEASVLFDASHVATWTPGLVLYAPFGAALASFRTTLWLLGILLDQPWFRNERVQDAYLALLGVSVTWRHADRLPAGRHLLVSNHGCVGDLMLLFRPPRLAPGLRYTHLVTSALPARVTRTRHLPLLLRPASPAVYDELAASADPSPVHLFPEGGMTNGRGMLRFSRGFTRIMGQAQQGQQQHLQQDEQQQQQGQEQPERGAQHHALGASASVSAAANAAAAAGRQAQGQGQGLPVVPVALRVRTLPGVSTHTLTSSFLANLFWLSFSPTTRLEATVLPPMVPLPGEARGAFVNRVQAAIATELGVRVYDMTIQQKKQLVQRAASAARK